MIVWKRFINNEWLIGAAFVAIIFHHESLSYYFFQDDFFHLLISKAQNLGDFIAFFKLRDDVIGYRPVTIQLYFFSIQSLFGLSPLFFRLINLTFLLGSSYLILKVFTRISSQKTVLIAAGIWLSSSIHFMSITWISASYQIIGTFFYLLTVYFFIKFIDLGKISFYSFAILSFVLTIGSFEFAVSLPFLLFIYLRLFKIQRLTHQIKILLPFFFIDCVYITLRFLFKDNPQIVDYNLKLDINSFKALFWYMLWALSLPEEFKYQVKNMLLIINSSYFSYFPVFIILSYTRLLVIVLLGFILPLFHSYSTKLRGVEKGIKFYSFWTVVSILPALLIPNHTYLMYLTLSSIGIYGAIATLLSLYKNKALPILFFAIWIYSSFATINFYRKTSYMLEAQQVSRKFIQNVTSQLPALPKNSSVLYSVKNPAHIQALSDQNALKAVYNDETLKTYWDEATLLKDFQKNIITGPIYIINQ